MLYVTVIRMELVDWRNWITYNVAWQLQGGKEWESDSCEHGYQYPVCLSVFGPTEAGKIRQWCLIIRPLIRGNKFDQKMLYLVQLYSHIGLRVERQFMILAWTYCTDDVVVCGLVSCTSSEYRLSWHKVMKFQPIFVAPNYLIPELSEELNIVWPVNYLLVEIIYISKQQI